MKPGLDTLGLAHHRFPVHDLIRLCPKGFILGAFLETFGPLLPRLSHCVDEIESAGVRLNLPWTNHKLSSPKAVEKWAKECERWGSAYPKLEKYLAHTCELDSWNPMASALRMGIIRQHAPSWIPVNSITPKGAPLPNEVNERHGTYDAEDGGYINSLDGEEDPDWRAWRRAHAAAIYRLGWIPELNGRRKGESAMPINSRTHWPTVPQLKLLIRRSK
jgi:hypothetical protein